MWPRGPQLAIGVHHTGDWHATIDHATLEQRAMIDQASITLRKARAVAQVQVTLRRSENGEDALLAHSADRRHVVDALGKLIDD